MKEIHLHEGKKKLSESNNATVQFKPKKLKRKEQL